MFHARFALVAALGACSALAAPASGADLAKGTPDIKSAGPLAFGPNGLLFVADAQGGAIFAVDTGDKTPDSAGGTFKIPAINEKIAGMLGTEAREVMINDMAVNPASGKVYLSVSRGRGPSASPVVIRADRSGKLEVVPMENVPFAKAALTALPNASPSAPAKKGAMSPRGQSITDLAYVDGRVYVAGLSNEKFSSRLVSIPYPFESVDDGTSVEIYHGAHGKYETSSPIRTFAPYKIKGESYLMASYTCTPLVKVPVAALKPGQHYKATTIAELGNHNSPLDMVVYQKDGKDYLLMANSSRGVMKIKAEGAADAPSISSPVRGEKETAGLPYETIASLKGVTQLDKLDDNNAVVLIEEQGGPANLETIPLP